MLDSFLSLKIKEVDYDGESTKQDGKTRKEMMQKMSRRERKVRATAACCQEGTCDMLKHLMCSMFVKKMNF